MLKEIYGKPFQAAITESSLRSVMPCYCSINGVPASSSRWLLTDVLRDEMGFDGTCISDYSAVGNVYNVQHVGESIDEAGLMCLEAGMDVEMQLRVAYNDNVKAMFESGKADMQILDTAVLRVLEAKFRMGLFEHPYALEGEALNDVFFDEKDLNLSLQSARESMILMKNEGALPIKKNVKKIAVIGTHASNARSFFGGYTHLSMVEATLATANSIAGLESGSIEGSGAKLVPGTQVQSDETEEFDAILKQMKPGCKNLLEELRERLPETEIVYAYGYPVAGNDKTHIEEAMQIAKDADLILMTLGGKNGSCSVATMGEGVDSTFIGLPECQEACILELAKLNIPMVGIHLDGRPISSDIADEYLNAIVEAWSPAETGAQAIVDVLTGAYNPGGKLPVSVSRSGAAIGVHYNHQNGSAWHQGDSIGFANYVDLPHTPRYYFGHGLSYTSFTYSDLMIVNKTIHPDDNLILKVTVTNSGDMAGDEVVQFYYTDEHASVNRPVKELAGFKRIHLSAGESVKL
jgi:beta-glucosidase